MHTHCIAYTLTPIYNAGLPKKLKFLFTEDKFLKICYGLYIQSYSKELVDIGHLQSSISLVKG